jgi:hypothetical protein
VRALLDLGSAEAFAPLFGGVLEIACLTLFWSGLLECRRTGRPIARQGRLFGGMSIALVPPIWELGTFLSRWAP